MRCPSFSLWSSKTKKASVYESTLPPAYATAMAETLSMVQSKPVKQVFFGRIIHSKSLKRVEIHKTAALGVDEDGTIQFLDGDAKSAGEACEKHQGFSNAKCTTLQPLQLLFPGLVDTHMHAPQYPNLTVGMDADLKEWTATITDPIEASYSDTSKAHRVYREMVRKELENGSTTVAYNSSIHAEATNVLADICLEFGQRAIIGKSCIDTGRTHGNREKNAKQSLEDEEMSVKHIKKIDPDSKLILPCIQPSGGSYVSPELAFGLGKLCEQYEPIRVQAHMCETQLEAENMHKVHPGFESYADMYDKNGLLGERSILAHCIHLSERDLEVMAEKKVGVAHNANSNTCLTDGWCQVRKLLDRGIKVGLGTDCSAGYSISVLDAMRQTSNVSRHLTIHTGDPTWKLTFEELVYLATMGGAEVCALEEKIGNFMPGKQFDALIVDLGLDDNININGFEDDDLAMLKKWVFMGDDRSIRRVYVNGKLVSGKDIEE